jgi:hypothetical protein
MPETAGQERKGGHADYLLDLAQLRAELGLGRDAAYQLLRDRGRRLGRRYLILRSEVAQLLIERDDGSGR